MCVYRCITAKLRCEDDFSNEMSLACTNETFNDTIVHIRICAYTIYILASPYSHLELMHFRVSYIALVYILEPVTEGAKVPNAELGNTTKLQ